MKLDPIGSRSTKHGIYEKFVMNELQQRIFSQEIQDSPVGQSGHKADRFQAMFRFIWYAFANVTWWGRRTEHEPLSRS